MKAKTVFDALKLWFNLALRKLGFPKKKFVYVALGDSAVEGVGATSHHKSFPALVFSAIKQEIGHVEYHNFGKSGARVLDVLKNQVEKAVEKQPDLVILSVGFNDVVKRTRLEDFEKDFAETLEILSKKTHALLVVNNIPDISLALSIPFYKKVYAQILIRRFNNTIKTQVHKNHASLVDMHSQTKMLKEYDGLISSDGLHPSDLGHALWGLTVLSHIWDSITVNRKKSSVKLAV